MFALRAYLRTALAVALLVVFGAAGGEVRAADTILTGKVVATLTRAALVPFASVVGEVLVKPGDKVVKGAPLLRCRLHEDAERALQRELYNGAETEDMYGRLLDLQRQLAQTQAQSNKARQLAASGLGSRQAGERLAEDVHSLQKRIELLRRSITKAENNFALRLKELSGHFGTEIREGEQLPEKWDLTAPIDGYVLSLDSSLHPGYLLAAGSAPIPVGQLDPVLIQVPVYEAEVSGIKEGDAVEVEIPSLQNKQFRGTVKEVSWVSSDMTVANPSYYTVELLVPNPDLELKPGFKAVARFKGSR